MKYRVRNQEPETEAFVDIFIKDSQGCIYVICENEKQEREDIVVIDKISGKLYTKKEGHYTKMFSSIGWF